MIRHPLYINTIDINFNEKTNKINYIANFTSEMKTDNSFNVFCWEENNKKQYINLNKNILVKDYKSLFTEKPHTFKDFLQNYNNNFIQNSKLNIAVDKIIYKNTLSYFECMNYESISIRLSCFDYYDLILLIK